ncbi:MAG: DNA helicase UvrD, partial [Chloroflexi bacterium]
MTDLLANLNPPQIRAVTTVNGPVLVLAGPGSGKTRVLTRRIAYLIDVAGVAPWNILAVTFTNKAAHEMRERVEQLLGEKFGPPLPGQPPRLGGLTIGTFHSICARLLRIETEAIGYARNWMIYDSADQLALVRNVLSEMNLDEKRYSPTAIRARISAQKNELVTPENYRASSYQEEIAGRVYARYQEALHNNNAMDFDDLLMRSVLLLRERDDLLRKYQEKWRYLLVDEFQDTNAAQYELVRLLAGKPTDNRNLFVVGDPDQAIYRFRGADYRNVQNFQHDYPDATVVLLEQNYRSTQRILDVANAVIANNPHRTPKRLHTENGEGLAVSVYEAYNEVEEAGYICEEIERLMANHGLTPGDIAVMYRTNAQSRALEEAFVLRQIKYKLIGGTRFYERKEVKDALAYLRVVHNPAATVSLDRIINEPARGIGPKTYGALKQWAAELGVNEYTALLILLHGPAEVSQ